MVSLYIALSKISTQVTSDVQAAYCSGCNPQIHEIKGECPSGGELTEIGRLA